MPETKTWISGKTSSGGEELVLRWLCPHALWESFDLGILYAETEMSHVSICATVVDKGRGSS